MSNVEYSRSLLGANRVRYDCPQCGERLRSPLTNAGQRDHCPECRAEFVVPGKDQLEHLRRETDRAEEIHANEKQQKVRLRQEQKNAKAEQRAAEYVAARKRQEQLAIEQENELQHQAAENRSRPKGDSDRTNRKTYRGIALACFVSVVCAFVFWLTCGFFVIQPIGAVPDGVTIVYWRVGTKLPFVSSADGLLKASGSDVSLLGRGVVLAGVAKPIKERELFRFGYSRTLYLWSTGGKEYSR